MAELRWNPFLKDYVIIASHRQNRPQLPKDNCPFCPGSGKVPEAYEVLKYDNDFPALLQDPPEPDEACGGFFRAEKTYGKCEVVLYSPKHTGSLADLPPKHMRKLVDLWCERFGELSADEKIKYVMIFENRGEEVGVTISHPHGQIYAYPFLPKKLELESQAAMEYYNESGECLFCRQLREETEDAKRFIFKNEHFSVFLPFHTPYPYGVEIMSHAHKGSITDLSEQERDSLGDIIGMTVGMLDSLYDKPFPYMMCMFSAPCNMGEQPGYHFHIEFYPPMRSGEKLKFNASSETGAWAHCNPRAPEETAEELRAAFGVYCATDKNREE